MARKQKQRRTPKSFLTKKVKGKNKTLQGPNIKLRETTQKKLYSQVAAVWKKISSTICGEYNKGTSTQLIAGAFEIDTPSKRRTTLQPAIYSSSSPTNKRERVDFWKQPVGIAHGSPTIKDSLNILHIQQMDSSL